MTSQEQVNLILGIATIVGPIVGFIVRDWWRKRKGTVMYGDNLLDAINKTTDSLRQARAEIASLDQQIMQMDKQHGQEIEDMQYQHKRERERLRQRIMDLEKVLERYEISFTLTTRPEVRVDNLRVTGIEDLRTITNPKMQAISKEQIAAHPSTKQVEDKDKAR